MWYELGCALRGASGWESTESLAEACGYSLAELRRMPEDWAYKILRLQEEFHVVEQRSGAGRSIEWRLTELVGYETHRRLRAAEARIAELEAELARARGA